MNLARHSLIRPGDRRMEYSEYGKGVQIRRKYFRRILSEFLEVRKTFLPAGRNVPTGCVEYDDRYQLIWKLICY